MSQFFQQTHIRILSGIQEKKTYENDEQESLTLNPFMFCEWFYTQLLTHKLKMYVGICMIILHGYVRRKLTTNLCVCEWNNQWLMTMTEKLTIHTLSDAISVSIDKYTYIYIICICIIKSVIQTIYEFCMSNVVYKRMSVFLFMFSRDRVLLFLFMKIIIYYICLFCLIIIIAEFISFCYYIHCTSFYYKWLTSMKFV